MGMAKDDGNCRRVTLKGIPCKGRHIKGSDFCWRHQPKEVWLPAIVTLVVGFLLGIGSNAFFSHRDQISAAHQGEVDRPREVPLIHKFPILVFEGGNATIISQPGYCHESFSWSPFSYGIAADLKIDMRGVIQDDSGCVVVEAAGCKVKARQGSRYDINSDNNAIEIVDSEQKPVFQLRIVPSEEFLSQLARSLSEGREELVRDFRTQYAGFVEACPELLRDFERVLAQPPAFESVIKEKEVHEVLQLCYVTRVQGHVCIITGQRPAFFPDSDYEHIQQCRNGIHRLFEYPAYKYPGKRVTEGSK
jgi:hypothetical protein